MAGFWARLFGLKVAAGQADSEAAAAALKNGSHVTQNEKAKQLETQYIIDQVGDLPTKAAVTIAVRAAQRLVSSNKIFDESKLLKDAIASAVGKVRLSARKGSTRMHSEELHKFNKPIGYRILKVALSLDGLALEQEIALRSAGVRVWQGSRDRNNKSICDVIITGAELLAVTSNPDHRDGVIARYFNAFGIDCQHLRRIASERGLDDNSEIAPEWVPDLWAQRTAYHAEVA